MAGCRGLGARRDASLNPGRTDAPLKILEKANPNQLTQVAVNNPARLFYAYTKSLPIWTANRACVPDNMVLTASEGGEFDAMIEPNKLRKATVVFHPDEAEALGLEIDHDDSLARSKDGRDFALLIHGMGSPGSKQNAATKRLKAEGVKYSYGKAAEENRQKVLAGLTK